jgi:hypothetical protein
MKKSILKMMLVMLSLQIEFKISVKGQKENIEKKTESTLNFDIKNPEDSVSDNQEIVKILNTLGNGYYTIQFSDEKNNKTFRTTLLKKENEPEIKDLDINLVLDKKGQVININVIKKFVKYDKKANYVKLQKITENNDFQDLEPSKKRENLDFNEPGQNPNPNNENPVVEKEKSFFQKYFWWIVIGGFLIMQLMKVDKEKIQEAYTQAQTQAENQRRVR